MNRSTFHKISYGVYVVSTWDHGRATGCIANSVMQITSSPATIAISINHDNYTNTCIKDLGRFAVSILAQNSDPSLIGTFGFQSGRDADKFSETKHRIEDGLPVIADSCGYLTCEVINQMETSTHTIFLGEVKGAELFENREPLTYAYYHNVIKGKSPKNAPTYIAEESPAITSETPLHRFTCQVCGYVYEGEILPADYTCPICQASAERFEMR